MGPKIVGNCKHEWSSHALTYIYIYIRQSIQKCFSFSLIEMMMISHGRFFFFFLLQKNNALLVQELYLNFARPYISSAGQFAFNIKRLSQGWVTWNQPWFLRMVAAS